MTCDPLTPLVSIITSESALVVDDRILHEYWSIFFTREITLFDAFERLERCWNLSATRLENVLMKQIHILDFNQEEVDLDYAHWWVNIDLSLETRD